MINIIAHERKSLGESDVLFQQAIGVVFVFANTRYRFRIERGAVELKIMSLTVTAYSEEVMFLVDEFELKAKLCTGGSEADDILFQMPLQ
jgi:hypothetical protein